MAPSRHPAPDGIGVGLPHVPPIRTLPELHCELRSAGPDYALAALNAFVAPKARYPANIAFVERWLDQAQRAFPEHAEAFRRLRSAYGIRTHLPAPPTASSSSASTSTSPRVRRPARQNRQQHRLRELAEQRAATDELHAHLRGSHAEAVTALDNFLVDAISDWDSAFAVGAVDDTERVFPEHAEAFAYIRSEWHLPPLCSGSLPVTPTSSAMPRSPFLGPARSLSPASPRLGNMKLSPPAEFGFAGFTERPPDYTKEDPDPSSTRLLEQRLAAEADGLGLSLLVPAPGYAFFRPDEGYDACGSAPGSVPGSAPLSPIPMSPVSDAEPMTRVTSYDAPSPMSPCSPDYESQSGDNAHHNEVNMQENEDVGDVDADVDIWEQPRPAAPAPPGPTYTFTAAQLAGIGLGTARDAYTAQLGLHSSEVGAPLRRERSGSGPTYTFTAEELAGVDVRRRRPPPPLRTGSAYHDVPAASFRSPAGTVEYTPPTYTFTADELARVGGRSSYWKAFRRRSSAPGGEVRRV